MGLFDDYFAKLKERAENKRISHKHQLAGLEIAQILNDERHKSLYIKLCKEQGPEKLLAIAKDISQRRDVKNKGAYFMAILKSRLPAKTEVGTPTNASGQKTSARGGSVLDGEN